MYSLVPLDDLRIPNLESKSLAPLARRVEFAPRGVQGADVVNDNVAPLHWVLARSWLRTQRVSRGLKGTLPLLLAQFWARTQARHTRVHYSVR